MSHSEENPIEIELKSDQVGMLNTLLRKRFRVFCIGLFAVLVIWLRISYSYLEAWYTLHIVYSPDEAEYALVEKVNNGATASLIMLLFFLFYFVRMFILRVIPLYKDTKEQKGAYIKILVTKKSIPYEGRCFIFLDSLKIPYKEVDYPTYAYYQAGDMMNVLVAKYSRTHIDEYLNVELL